MGWGEKRYFLEILPRALISRIKGGFKAGKVLASRQLVAAKLTEMIGHPLGVEQLEIFLTQ